MVIDHSKNKDNSNSQPISIQDDSIISPVELDETYSLKIYYPNYSRIDLVCGEMPKKDNDSVIMACAAAYTVKCLDHLDHSNIIGNHVSNGILYTGASSDTYRGAFSYYDSKPHFSYKNWNSDLREASNKGGCLFAQDMMIHDGKIVDYCRDKDSKSLFRALCLIDGRMAIVDSKESIPFGNFISLLTKIGATEAIYLDMGGWKHSWYRDESGNAVDIYPSPTKFGTNWITFYR
ncbi:MAG: hypothetical protein K2G88_00995 [Oscillospiraceae bacterium]|nr:hypothetical protein [Oscillospiraceae bacterium]